MTTYQNNIKKIRERLGLSQFKLALRFKLNIADRISRWESGKAMPSIKNIIRLAEVLEVSPDEIYPELFAELKKKYEKKDVK
jgi:transcriptional regulator with XRE-family HTH domain